MDLLRIGVTILIVLSIIGSWMGIGKEREVKTYDYALLNTLIHLLVLYLLW